MCREFIEESGIPTGLILECGDILGRAGTSSIWEIFSVIRRSYDVIVTF